MCRVSDSRHDAAGGSGAFHHIPGAVPEDGRDAQVHYHVDKGVQKGEGQQNLQLCFNQIVVGFAEAKLLVGFPHAGLDDADSGDILLQHVVHNIQFFLLKGKQRVQLAQSEIHGADDEGQGAQHDEGEIGAQGEHEIQAADGHQYRAYHAPYKLGDEPFHLGHIVGDAGDKGTGAEGIDLGERERHNLPEHVLAKVVAHILAGHVDEHIVQGTEAAADEYHADHLDA